ncbi:hypothetical protein AB0E08_03475 [Streptomyces sp. NPDC048281]|uniref:hypothetical protein n=1 Tax=Streptomyces sp. NPDC048281 TaxID=3154715 RepID=UPI00341EF9B9
MPRKRTLPDNAELLKLEEAGLSHAEIAAMHDVSRQAVTKLFNNMGEYVRGPVQAITDALPWDIAALPAKDRLRDQDAYIGLRAFVREQLGADVSPRSQVSLRAFLNHIANGEVLELDPNHGARYVKRDPQRDESLVIRWPAEVPRDARTDLFRLRAAQGVSPVA